MDAQRKNFFKGVAIGTFLGVLLQVGGYLITRGDRHSFGWAMFLLVPFVSGFAVAAVVRKPRRVVACIVTGGIITFSVLLFTGWEGIVCCVMSLPLVAVGVALGAWAGYEVRGRVIDQMEAPGKTSALIVLLSPFLIAAGDRVERSFRGEEAQEVFTTEALFSAPPAEVWARLATMHLLDGPRPFLLRVGLPVPTRCELSAPAVGARRVCYFDRGLIAQEVTDWQVASFMGLRITENTLPGRDWLTFINANYELVPAGEQTRLIRRTTIGTNLYPRWYWRPLERWGVHSEHEFVIANLKRAKPAP